MDGIAKKMMSQGRFMTIAVAFVALALVLFISLTALQETASEDDRGPAPDLTMPIGKDGAKVQLSSFKNQVVLLDFWATWCGPCRMSIPELQKLHEKYKDQGLVVIGLSTDYGEGRKRVPEMKKNLGMTYATAFTDDIPNAREEYGFESLPMLFVIDRKGIIRHRFVGYDPKWTLEEEVVKLLQEK